LAFFLDNINVAFGDEIFQQSDGISIGINCAPLLADLSLYSYEAELVQKLLRDKNKNLLCPLTIHIDILVMSY
jgi:hypothetical protein